MELSIIIPVYNEEEQINNFIKHLTIFDEPNIEVLFVDGGSQDQTATMIKEFGYKLFTSEKGRGNQLNKGAEEAKGDVLLFLHSDSYFRQSPLEEIKRILTMTPIGAFPLRFEPSNLILKCIAWGSNWRIRHRNIAFGDQGIFMRKNFYHQMGGIDKIPLMEDYAWSLKVKEAGYVYYSAEIPIFTSSRRFKQNGSLLTLVKMQYCQWLFRRGVPLKKIMNIYYG